MNLVLTLVLILATQRPAFEAASVKANKSSETGSARTTLTQRGGHVTLVRFSLRMLLGQAYNLPSLSDAFNRIVGAPNWADSEYFDIEAQVEGNPSVADKRLMLQSLLADRFKLELHTETRQRNVFGLVLDKPSKFGPRIKAHTDDSACTQRVTLPPSSDPVMDELLKFPCGRVVGGLVPGDSSQAWSGGRNVTMEAIAASMGGSEQFDRPILDRSGIRGTFDFTLQWHTLLQDLSTSPPSDPGGLPLATAIREQLGLKLVSGTGPVMVWVIDHVERPKPN